VYMYSIVAGSTGGPRTGAPSQPCARAREPTCAFTALTDRPGARAWGARDQPDSLLLCWASGPGSWSVKARVTVSSFGRVASCFVTFNV
jgi:hypothetical protein